MGPFITYEHIPNTIFDRVTLCWMLLYRVSLSLASFYCMSWRHCQWSSFRNAWKLSTKSHATNKNFQFHFFQEINLIFLNKFNHLSNSVQSKSLVEPGNSCCRGRLSTIDLLVLTSLNQLLFLLKMSLKVFITQPNLTRSSNVLSLSLQLMFLLADGDGSVPMTS